MARAVVVAAVRVVSKAVVRAVLELPGIEDKTETIGVTEAAALIGTIVRVLLPVTGQNLLSITARIERAMICFSSAIFLLHSNTTLLLSLL